MASYNAWRASGSRGLRRPGEAVGLLPEPLRHRRNSASPMAATGWRRAGHAPLTPARHALPRSSCPPPPDRPHRRAPPGSGPTSRPPPHPGPCPLSPGYDHRVRFVAAPAKPRIVAAACSASNSVAATRRSSRQPAARRPPLIGGGSGPGPTSLGAARLPRRPRQRLPGADDARARQGDLVATEGCTRSPQRLRRPPVGQTGTSIRSR